MGVNFPYLCSHAIKLIFRPVSWWWEWRIGSNEFLLCNCCIIRILFHSGLWSDHKPYQWYPFGLSLWCFCKVLCIQIDLSIYLLTIPVYLPTYHLSPIQAWGPSWMQIWYLKFQKHLLVLLLWIDSYWSFPWMVSDSLGVWEPTVEVWIDAPPSI